MSKLIPPTVDTRPLHIILSEAKIANRVGPFPRWQKGMQKLRGGATITPAVKLERPELGSGETIREYLRWVNEVNTWARGVKNSVVLDGAPIPRVSVDAPGNHANMKVAQWAEYFAGTNPKASNTLIMSFATACFREWGKLHYHKMNMAKFVARGAPAFPPLDSLVVPANGDFVQGGNVWFPDSKSWLKSCDPLPVMVGELASYELAKDKEGELWVRFKLETKKAGEKICLKTPALA